MANSFVEQGASYDSTRTLEEKYVDVFQRQTETSRRTEKKGYESPSLRISPSVKEDYELLKKDIAEGVDIMTYLSRTVEDNDYEDRLLNDWGLHHLHLKRRPDRSKEVLIVRFESADAYILQLPVERTTLRRKHLNAVVEVKDGTCYGSLGSGLMGSGVAMPTSANAI